MNWKAFFLPRDRLGPRARRRYWAVLIGVWLGLVALRAISARPYSFGGGLAGFSVETAGEFVSACVIIELFASVKWGGRWRRRLST
jgi:hypothetical protein